MTSSCLTLSIPMKMRKSLTRKALVGAAIRMISDGRMDSATIDDIVGEADVAKGSFYKHFPNRDALKAHAHDAVRAELFVIINAISAEVEDPATYLTLGLLAAFRFGLENKITARVLLHMPADVVNPARADNAPILAMFHRGIQQGIFKLSSLDAGLVLLMGLTDLGLARLLEVQNEFLHLREVMQGICMAFLRGLGVNNRRAERIVKDAMKKVIDSQAIVATIQNQHRSAL